MIDGLSIPLPPPTVINQFASPLAKKVCILGFFTKTASIGDKDGDIYWTAVLKK